MDSNWVSAALTVLRWAAFIICFWLVQLKHTTGSWSSFVEMSKSIPTLITRSRGWVESGRRAASRSAQSQSQLELRVCSRLHLSLTFLSPTLLIVFLVSWLIVQSIKNPRILKNIHHISSESLTSSDDPEQSRGVQHIILYRRKLHPGSFAGLNPHMTDVQSKYWV